MKIDIITTGEELLSGVTLDTNSSWLAENCKKYGHKIIRMITVGDNSKDIVNALLSSKANCVIISGGLGPTSDDLTIESAGKAFNLKLVEDEKTRKKIEDFFIKRKREISRTNYKQALILKKSTVMENKIGTAPGIKLDYKNKTFFFLPGVPRELYPMFRENIEPWLKKYSDKSVFEKIFTCFGIPEATIGEKIESLKLKNVYLGYRVKFPYVEIKIQGGERETKRAFLKIKKILSENIVSNEAKNLEHVVGMLLKKYKLKIAVAESCTGGLLASTITDVSGSSNWFERGVVTYSNEAKIELLGVKKETLIKYGAVSEETAREMAGGILQKSKADITVSLTGIAGPLGGTRNKPVGTLCIGLALKNEIISKKFSLHYDRERFKKMAVALALDMIRKKLNYPLTIMPIKRK